MKKFFEKIGVKENRGWGVIALLMLCGLITPFITVVVLILWWEKFEKEEKEMLLNLLIAVVLIFIFACIPFVGWVAAIVWIVFFIINMIKYFKGDFGARVLLAGKIAAAIAKK